MGKQHVWVIISFCFPLFMIHGHWRRIYEKRLEECLNSFPPLPGAQMERGIRDRYCRNYFQEIFVLFLMYLQAVLFYCQCATQSWGKIHYPSAWMPSLLWPWGLLVWQWQDTSLTQRFLYLKTRQPTTKRRIKEGGIKKNVIKSALQIGSRQHLRNFKGSFLNIGWAYNTQRKERCSTEDGVPFHSTKLRASWYVK